MWIFSISILLFAFLHEAHGAGSCVSCSSVSSSSLIHEDKELGKLEDFSTVWDSDGSGAEVESHRRLRFNLWGWFSWLEDCLNFIFNFGGLDLSSLQPTLEKHSLKIGQEVGADGSCFFRSLSFLVFGDEEAHWELRLQVLAEMEGSPEAYRELFSHSDRASEFESLESYLEAFPEVSFFADEVSVFAVRRTRFSLQGRSFMVRLSVFTDYGSVLEYEPEAEAFAGEVLALKVGLLSSVEHYVPLVEADAQRSHEPFQPISVKVDEESHLLEIADSESVSEISNSAESSMEPELPNQRVFGRVWKWLRDLTRRIFRVEEQEEDVHRSFTYVYSPSSSRHTRMSRNGFGIHELSTSSSLVEEPYTIASLRGRRVMWTI